MQDGSDHMDFRAMLQGERILPVAVLRDAAKAEPLGAAIRRAGLSTIEVMLRTDAATAAIAALAAAGDLIVGAGTVNTPADAKMAIGAGAKFIVSPGVNEALVSYCNQVGVPVLPGVATATEILNALEFGCTEVKFFPAEVSGGVAAIRALSAPFPDLKFVPTGGISAASLGTYLQQSSVLAVGGTWLTPPSLIAASDWSAIEALVGSAIDIRDRLANA